jgi:type IV pilus assembly protein PilC
LLKARKEVEEGKTLVDPLKRMKLFPPMVTQMIAVGEQTGELDNMLGKLADCYEEESDTAIANLLTSGGSGSLDSFSKKLSVVLHRL